MDKLDEKTEITGQIHSIESFGTLDGPGIRTVIFFQGCPLRCKFCHNIDCAPSGAGKEYTVSELVKKVMKNKSYWKNGGGVTCSGGEPTFQPIFLEKFVTELSRNNVNITIDSCSVSSRNLLRKIADKIDLWMLSIKHLDNQKHKELTGRGNEIILKNIKFLDKLISKKNLKSKIRVRFLVVPGITDSERHVDQLKEFVSSVENLEGVEVLGYGSHGRFKWEELFGMYHLQDVPDATEEQISLVRSRLDDYLI